jgi:hypothetical protein
MLGVVGVTGIVGIAGTAIDQIRGRECEPKALRRVSVCTCNFRARGVLSHSHAMHRVEVLANEK